MITVEIDLDMPQNNVQIYRDVLLLIVLIVMLHQPHFTSMHQTS